jgi:predicted dehydrogenase/threonine dehydrogenase-like Zn-dependent dehydrogenase
VKQILQNIRNGQLSVADVPAPLAQPGHLVIANAASLISAGTEKMVMDLAGKSLLAKAKERPDHVRRVIEKARNEGLLNTIRSVREKLDDPMTMGYSSAGIVLACGGGVENYKPGDRVASNGSHAELVAVPVNLCAAIPADVTLEHASFAVLGSIALQGIRLARVELGATVFVIGLGLVGQLTVNLLAASGCRVIGTDLDPAKCELAKRMGASVAEPGLSAARVEQASAGLGADAVLITASTKSNGPIELAAASVRKRGRVVLVGVVGLELDRRPFYFKEAEFVVSCSYGPGRYDPDYEELGRDYPAAYVRWTEQRNIAAVLQSMSAGGLDVEPLISHRFPVERATDAYAMIKAGDEPFLGVLLQYDSSAHATPVTTIQLKRECDSQSSVLDGDRKHHGPYGVGVIGVGNFARTVLIPQIVSNASLSPVILCSAAGVHAAHSGEKHGFQRASTDEDAVFADAAVDVVFSVTQHHLHARHVCKAIDAGKHIFVEKPLCLTLEELQEIEQALRNAESAAPNVMVGFNRRFAPLAQQLKDAVAKSRATLTISFRFNAGAISADHWTQHPELGGGRIIGEACHAIDFVTWLTDSLPVKVYAESVGGNDAAAVSDDQCFITIRHANGSVSNIAYLAGGDKACPKERIEVFGGGVTAILDDFRSLTVYDHGKRNVTKARQDKGHRNEVRRFADAVKNGTASPISWPEVYSTTLTSILAVESLREGVPMLVHSAETQIG